MLLTVNTIFEISQFYDVFACLFLFTVAHGFCHLMFFGAPELLVIHG